MAGEPSLERAGSVHAARLLLMLLLGRQVRLQNTGATRKKDVRTVSSASLCGRRVSLGQEGISEGSEQDEVLGWTLQSPRPQSAVSSTHVSASGELECLCRCSSTSPARADAKVARSMGTRRGGGGRSAPRGTPACPRSPPSSRLPSKRTCQRRLHRRGSPSTRGSPWDRSSRTYLPEGEPTRAQLSPPI